MAGLALAVEKVRLRPLQRDVRHHIAGDLDLVHVVWVHDGDGLDGDAVLEGGEDALLGVVRRRRPEDDGHAGPVAQPRLLPERAQPVAPEVLRVQDQRRVRAAVADVFLQGRKTSQKAYEVFQLTSAKVEQPRTNSRH